MAGGSEGNDPYIIVFVEHMSGDAGPQMRFVNSALSSESYEDTLEAAKLSLREHFPEATHYVIARASDMGPSIRFMRSSGRDAKA